MICTLGDLLLDVIVRLRAPLASGADASAETRTGAGGQAANVAAWAAGLGAEARFIGKRGHDAAGELAAAELAALGVSVLGPVMGRNGVIVSLVEPGGERTMASDRGIAPELRADEIDEAWLDGCSHLHLSGYSVMSSPIDGAAAKAIGAARRRGAPVSIDLSSWSVIREFGPERARARLSELAPDVIFANERELKELGGELPAPTWVLKRGAAGCVVGRSRERVELPAEPGDVVDTTGAGDALAAGFLLGGTLEEAARRGLATAARCVAQLGAMP